MEKKWFFTGTTTRVDHQNKVGLPMTQQSVASSSGASGPPSSMQTRRSAVSFVSEAGEEKASLLPTKATFPRSKTLPLHALWQHRSGSETDETNDDEYDPCLLDTEEEGGDAGFLMCPEAEDYGIAALRQQPSVFPQPSEELPTTITPAQRKPLLHIPYLPWMRYKGYLKKNFGKDLMAGIVVSVVAIPQGLAYAVLASLPAQMGLYTSCIPPLVYGFLGTSRHLSAGPVALVSMFIPQIAVSLHMSEDSNLRVIVAAAACVVSGLLLLVVGVFRMGSLVKFISSPVLAGFTTAAAVVIGVDQLQHLVGYPFSKDSKYNWDMVNDLIANVGETNPLTLLIGGSTVLFLVGVRQVSRKHKKVKWLKLLSVTSTLIAVVCATTAAFLFSHQGYQLPLVGHVPAGLPHFLVPSAAITDLASVGSLVVACMPVTCLAFMSSWSLARNYAVKSGQTDLDANQEAVSQALHAPTFPTRSSSSISPLPLLPSPVAPGGDRRRQFRGWLLPLLPQLRLLRPHLPQRPERGPLPSQQRLRQPGRLSRPPLLDSVPLLPAHVLPGRHHPGLSHLSF